jgi:hypothetical protein
METYLSDISYRVLSVREYVPYCLGSTLAVLGPVPGSYPLALFIRESRGKLDARCFFPSLNKPHRRAGMIAISALLTMLPT